MKRILALIVLLASAEVQAGEFGLELGLGYHPALPGLQERSRFSAQEVGTVELDYRFNNALRCSVFHMSNPFRVDRDYGVNAVLIKWRVR